MVNPITVVSHAALEYEKNKPAATTNNIGKVMARLPKYEGRVSGLIMKYTQNGNKTARVAP